MSTTSADPDDLDHFVDIAGKSRRALAERLQELRGQASAVVAASADFVVHSNVLVSGARVLSALEHNERFVAKVSETLRRADRDPATGVASVSSTAVAAALAAAGLSQPPGPVTVEPGVLLGIPPTSGFVDDPICAANGNFVEAETDLAFPGRTAVLDVMRVYNSLAHTTVGAFGPGWSSPLDLRVDHVAGGVVRVRLADGAVVPFVAGEGDEPGVLRAVGSRPLRIRAEDGGWVLHEGHTKTWRFDAGGRLVGGVAGAARLEVERDGERVVGLSEGRSGRWVRFEWDGHRVVAAHASDGRRVDYRYADGVLVGVGRPTGAVTYETDGTLLTAVVDADGVVLARNVYDEGGRVEAQTNEFGRTTRYQYGELGTTVVSDTTGGPRNAFTHDGAGNVTAVVDGTGRAMRLAYDEAGRTTRVTGRDGAVRAYAYDEAGNMVERTDPDGGRTAWAWDQAARLVAETHRNGAVTTYHYEGGHRRPSRIVEPGGATITIDVDEDDQPRRIVDADGVATGLEWDADGQLVALTDGLGQRSTFAYDPAGLLAGVTDGSGVVTELHSDAAGRVVEALVGAGAARYAYSPAGRPLGGCDAEGVSWSATYGPHGRATAFVDGAGSTVGFEWDVLGRLAAVVAPDGERYEHRHDPAGRLVGALDPEGRESRREVDPEGRVVAVIDPVGRTWRRRLDPLGRTAAVVAPDGATTSYDYHFNGVVARITGPDGATVATEVDTAGRISAVVDQLGGRHGLTYTPAGRLAARRSPSGRVVTWEHDRAGRAVGASSPAGQLRLERDGRGRATRAVGAEGEVSYAYSDAGEVVGIDGRAGALRLERDGAGRITALTDGEGVRSAFSYDARGLLAAATAPDGLVSRFSRDTRGRLGSSHSPSGEATAWGYDRTGFLQSVTDPTGTLARVLDPTGVVLAEHRPDTTVIEAPRDPAGRPVAMGPPGASLARFAYDRAGRLVEAVRVGDGESRTTLAWDPAGRLVGVTGPAAHLAIARDAQGAVTAWRIPQGEVRLRRDATGRVVGLDDPSVGAVEAPAPRTHRRDRAGRVTGSDGGAVYRYDQAGRLVEALDPLGRRWAFSYGPDGLLAGEDSPLGRRRYHRGQLGRVERIVDDEGETRFTYDAGGRRRTAERSDGSATRWHWDALGQLVAVEELASDGARRRLDIALDGLGRPWRLGEHHVVWDDALSAKPAQVGDTRYLHLGDRSRPATADGRWSAPPADPWGSTATAEPALGFHDHLAAWGLVWMGARVYDPASREFLSPDPLPPVPGRPGFASAYAYGFYDPVNYLDPSGRRPVSQAEFDQIREREEQGRLGQAWQAVTEDPWGTLAMIGVVAVGVALLFTPAAAIGAGILIGAAVPAATGVLTGTFSPRMVALGGAVGAIPGGNSYRSAIAFGAGTGSIGEAGAQAVRGEGFDVGNILLAGGLGGLFGGAARGVHVRINGARGQLDMPAPPTRSEARFEVGPQGVVTDLGAPRTVISGHGSYDPANGSTHLPEGTWAVGYAPHGASITDELGNAIETGTQANRIGYARTFDPGSEIPNYTVHPPDGLNIQGNPITVSQPTQLGELLRPGMGECHLAFCFYEPGHPLQDVVVGLK